MDAKTGLHDYMTLMKKNLIKNSLSSKVRVVWINSNDIMPSKILIIMKKANKLIVCALKLFIRIILNIIPSKFEYVKVWSVTSLTSLKRFNGVVHLITTLANLLFILEEIQWNKINNEIFTLETEIINKQDSVPTRTIRMCNVPTTNTSWQSECSRNHN